MSSLRLCIETTGPVCSVAVATGSELLALKEITESFQHASQITLLIDQCLRAAGIPLDDIQAIVLSEGPGSYTGLRVGASAAKGICYGQDIPLIGVNTLLALASGMLEETKDLSRSLLCPMIDARRMEVFTALYDRELNEILPPGALTLTESFKNTIDQEGESVVFGGDGAEKFMDNFEGKMYKYCSIRPSAAYLIGLSENKFQNKEFSDITFFKPQYLKPPHITTPKKVL